MRFADEDDDEDFTAALFDDEDLQGLFPLRYRALSKVARQASKDDQQDDPTPR